MPEKDIPDQETEGTRPWDRARAEYNRRFKTVDALCDHIERLEKQARRQKRAGARPAVRIKPKLGAWSEGIRAALVRMDTPQGSLLAADDQETPRGVRSAKAHAAKKAKPAARHGRPANGKPVHKA